jgi:hypothetical protein
VSTSTKTVSCRVFTLPSHSCRYSMKSSSNHYYCVTHAWSYIHSKFLIMLTCKAWFLTNSSGCLTFKQCWSWQIT